MMYYGYLEASKLMHPRKMPLSLPEIGLPEHWRQGISIEHLQGIVERVTYHAEDSGYTVALLKAPGERDLLTIMGRFPALHAGQTLRLSGFWREHLKYGQKSGSFPADSGWRLMLHVVDILVKKI